MILNIFILVLIGVFCVFSGQNVHSPPTASSFALSGFILNRG